MYTQTNVATISDMRLNPKSLLNKAENNPIFMFYHSRPKAVLLSIAEYQNLQDIFEDYLLSLKAQEYSKEDKTKIKWIPLSRFKSKTR